MQIFRYLPIVGGFLFHSETLTALEFAVGLLLLLLKYIVLPGIISCWKIFPPFTPYRIISAMVVGIGGNDRITAGCWVLCCYSYRCVSYWHDHTVEKRDGHLLKRTLTLLKRAVRRTTS